MSDQPAPERVRVSGPLARFADGFRVDLIERGYSLWRAQEQLYLLAHVSRWMEAGGLELAALTPATLESYFVWRRREGYRKSLSPLSLRRLLGYLDGLGVLPADDTVPTPWTDCSRSFAAICSRSAGSRPERSSCMSRPRDCFCQGAQSRWLMIWLACRGLMSTRSCSARRAGALRGRRR